MYKTKTKNQEVVDGILQYISTNNLSINEFIPSEKQLQELFAVSRVTVRSAISVLEDKGILKGERGRGTYVVGLPEGFLAHKMASKLIGFVCYNGISSPFMSNLAKGIESGADKMDYHICLSSVMGGSDMEAQAIRKLLVKGVDGLIVAPVESNPPSDFLCELAQSKTRLVIVDERIDEIAAPCVLCDDRAGGFLATEALIKSGHQRIAHIGGPVQKANALERFEGYRKALQRYSIDYNECLVPQFDKFAAGENEGKKAVAQLLGLPKSKRPTAMFAANDLMATGAWGELISKGYRIPDDFSLIGYGNEFNHSFLPLSSIEQNPVHIGDVAWNILKNLIDGGKPVEESITMLRPELVLRSSISEPTR